MVAPRGCPLWLASCGLAAKPSSVGSFPLPRPPAAGPQIRGRVRGATVTKAAFGSGAFLGGRRGVEALEHKCPLRANVQFGQVRRDMGEEPRCGFGGHRRVCTTVLLTERDLQEREGACHRAGLCGRPGWRGEWGHRPAGRPLGQAVTAQALSRAVTLALPRVRSGENLRRRR